MQEAQNPDGVLRHLQRLLRAPAARRRAPDRRRRQLAGAACRWRDQPARPDPRRSNLPAKGHYYSPEALLAGNYLLAEPFRNGLFATTYLAPRDYHRVHMPCAGVLREMIYVPGDLFSVNPLTAANVPNLFARNERVICVFDTDIGPMVQIRSAPPSSAASRPSGPAPSRRRAKASSNAGPTQPPVKKAPSRWKRRRDGPLQTRLHGDQPVYRRQRAVRAAAA